MLLLPPKNGRPAVEGEVDVEEVEEAWEEEEDAEEHADF